MCDLSGFGRWNTAPHDVHRYSSLPASVHSPQYPLHHVHVLGYIQLSVLSIISSEPEKFSREVNIMGVHGKRRPTSGTKRRWWGVVRWKGGVDYRSLFTSPEGQPKTFMCKHTASLQCIIYYFIFCCYWLAPRLQSHCLELLGLNCNGLGYDFYGLARIGLEVWPCLGKCATAEWHSPHIIIIYAMQSAFVYEIWIHDKLGYSNAYWRFRIFSCSFQKRANTSRHIYVVTWLRHFG